MAHGTGRYLIRKYNADLRNEEYVTLFFQTRNYYYEEMSDCYEPTWKDEDEYDVKILKWRTDRYGHKVADCASEGYKVCDIDKDMANKIYWNIKNRKINFETCRKLFAEIAGREIRA